MQASSISEDGFEIQRPPPYVSFRDDSQEADLAPTGHFPPFATKHGYRRFRPRLCGNPAAGWLGLGLGAGASEHCGQPFFPFPTAPLVVSGRLQVGRVVPRHRDQTCMARIRPLTPSRATIRLML